MGQLMFKEEKAIAKYGEKAKRVIEILPKRNF